MATAKGKYDTANTAFTGASDGTKIETIAIDNTGKLGLWEDSNVKMSFTAAKANIPGLKTKWDTAVSTHSTAVSVDLKKLTDAKALFDAELARRKEQ